MNHGKRLSRSQKVEGLTFLWALAFQDKQNKIIESDSPRSEWDWGHRGQRSQTLCQRILVNVLNSSVKAFCFPFLPSPTTLITSQLPAYITCVTCLPWADASGFRGPPTRSVHSLDTQRNGQMCCSSWLWSASEEYWLFQGWPLERKRRRTNVARRGMAWCHGICLLAGFPKPFVLVFPAVE